MCGQWPNNTYKTHFELHHYQSCKLKRLRKESVYAVLLKYAYVKLHFRMGTGFYLICAPTCRGISVGGDIFWKHYWSLQLLTLGCFTNTQRFWKQTINLLRKVPKCSVFTDWFTNYHLFCESHFSRATVRLVVHHCESPNHLNQQGQHW